MKKNFFVLFVLFLLTGCQALPEQSFSPPPQNIQPIVLTNPSIEQTQVSVDLSIKENNIYCSDVKVGKFEHGRIFMKLYDQTVSFEAPAIEELRCIYDLPFNGGGYIGFSYRELEISPKLFSPYGRHQTIETAQQNNQIQYRCDGALAKVAPQNGQGKHTLDSPYFDCQTNGKNYLTQYEFNAATGFPALTTGGELTLDWKKIYIKNVNGTNYMFIGLIAYDNVGFWSYDTSPDAQKEYQNITSKKYLDTIVQEERTKESLALWQRVVDSFRVESKKL